MKLLKKFIVGTVLTILTVLASVMIGTAISAVLYPLSSY
jgi:hypothetical protein